MDTYQIAKKTSLLLIIKESKSNLTTIQLIPKFANGITLLETILGKIDAISIQQAKDLTGITEDKSSVMSELKDFIVDVSGALHSHAVDNNDKTLQAKINFKETAVSRMSNVELITTAGIVFEEATKIGAAALAEEGITAEEMNEFADTYNQFKLISNDPREAIIGRSSYTQQLADLFEEANNLKKNTLDRLATQFKRKDPEFYLKYKAAATVIYRRGAKAKATPSTDAPTV